MHNIPVINPVLLCGGSGTRLWPLSRKSFPKQFAHFSGQKSLFQQAAQRVSGSCFAEPLAVTGEGFRFIVAEQLEHCGLQASGILIEPESRNTAPAALAAALYLASKDPTTLILLVPADHAIQDSADFRDTILKGVPAATQGEIVTYGIQPTRAETGYGWLETSEETSPEIYSLSRFIEKPNCSLANTLLADDRYLWNAGIFLVRADILIDAFQKYAPDILNGTRAAMAAATTDLGFLRIDPTLWKKIRSASIDFAVMEHAQNISVVRFSGNWSDLGSWEAIWKASPQDNNGNALSGLTTSINCENSLLRSESEEIELVGIGLKNLVVVAMRDAVLVADLTDSQSVRQAVEILNNKGAKQAVQLPVDHRPWGWFETLILADRFQVKRIHVHPGASLSLQSHFHRSEHWIVVAGTAKVTVNEEVQLLTENQSVYIPLGSIHRMENPGKVPMVLIEVQTGSYLDEDDIIRYDDVYSRL